MLDPSPTEKNGKISVVLSGPLEQAILWQAEHEYDDAEEQTLNEWVKSWAYTSQ